MKNLHINKAGKTAWITLMLALVFAWASSEAYSKNQPSGGGEKHSWTLGYEPDKTVIYSEPAKGKPLKLDCFFPEEHQASDQRGCVIFFFGGGWMGGSTKQFYGYSQYFASRGLVAIAAQYRTRKSHKAIPRNCVEDGKAAIRYVRAHAKELGIDPDKIIVGGGSAGGHVAAASTMCPKIDATPDASVSPAANALILFNPVYDNGPDGYGHSRVKDYWEAISPMHNIVAGLPPTIVFFGDRDAHAPVATINAFQQKMEAAGNQCETHIYKGEKHGFFHISKGGRDMFEDVLTKADAFLVKNGFLTGSNAVKEWTAAAITNLSKKKINQQSVSPMDTSES